MWKACRVSDAWWVKMKCTVWPILVLIITQWKYGYEGYRQFSLPRARFISRDAAERNKHWQGAIQGAIELPVSRNNHTLIVLLYRYNTIRPMPAYLLFMNMWISNVTLLCQDYAMVLHLPRKNFVVNWTKPYLSWLMMKKCFHTNAYLIW